jgi:precorrin-6B methylase 2
MWSIVEIGSWKGRSTYALCSGCRGIVYAIDNFSLHPLQNPYKKFLDNMKDFTNLKLLKMDSESASRSPEIPPKVDMVFVDGDHSYEAVIKDLQVWDSRTEKLICGHDYTERNNGVRVAVDEFYGTSAYLQGKVKYLRGIWMVYK